MKERIGVTGSLALCVTLLAACGTDDTSGQGPITDFWDGPGADTDVYVVSPDEAVGDAGMDATTAGDADAALGDIVLPDTRPERPPGSSPDEDLDGDGTVNRFDPDDDDDGLSDDTEQRVDTENSGCVWLVDCDGDGLSDSVEGTGDTDGDGIADMLDDDSDGDGVPDAEQFVGVVCQGGWSIGIHSGDYDLDRVPNEHEGVEDTDGDGASDLCDGDSDGDGILDGDEVTWLPSGDFVDLDSDADGTVDRLDEDGDGDGVPDVAEVIASCAGVGVVTAETCWDPDGDGLPTWRDVDSDGDGRPDGDSYIDVGGHGLLTLRDLDRDRMADFIDLDDDGDELRDIYESGCPAAPNHDESDSDGDGWEDFWEAAFGLPMTAGCDASVSPADLGVVRAYDNGWSVRESLVAAAEGVGGACTGQAYELVARTWPDELDPACILSNVVWTAESDAPCEGAGLVDTDGDGVIDAAVGYRSGDTLSLEVWAHDYTSCMYDMPRLKNGLPWIVIGAVEIDLLVDGETIATWRWAVESG